ncbi:MAG TPA: carboxypeptidase-like regulatory domain-containing protein [Clostridia bacterium]|nr:carboxypeptidase-like regulatory domain-containing protein [Clostridia bacterium]
MKKTIAVLLALSLAFFAGCGNPTPKVETGKVTITVTDGNGAPIKGATVTLTDGDGKETTAASSSSGVAVFDALPYGEYDVASSMAGFADGTDTITVDSSSQDVALDMTADTGDSTDSGQDTDAIGDVSVIDSLTSYRYKWTTLSEGDARGSVIEGGTEKPNSEYSIVRDKEGKAQMEFYKVGDTLRMGTAGNWQTLSGDDAKDFGYGESFISTLSNDYADMKSNWSDWKKSDGGAINGYDTDKYTYSGNANGTTVTDTAYYIKSGEFKGVMTRYDISYQSDADATKRSGYTIDVYDLNKPLGIKLP